MPQPNRSDVHVNKPLTNISIAYIQKAVDFVSDKVFPILPVMKQSDKYFSYDKKFWFQTQAQKRAPSSESAGSSYTIDSTNTYFADVFAVHKDISDQIRDNADAPLDMDRDATLFVTQQMLLRREKQFMSQYVKASTWTGAPDFTPSTLWDASGSDPVQDVEDKKAEIKEKTGFEPRTFLISRDVYSALKSNALILDRIKYTQRAVVTADLLAALFDLDKVLVASATEDTAPEGEASAMSFLMKNKGLLVYAAPAPSILQPSGGYTFSWQGLFGAGAQGNRIKSFRMEPLESDRVEGEMAFDMKLVGADLGCYMTGLIS